MFADYSSITEVPGRAYSRSQLGRIRERYEFARDQIAGGTVLEVACGAGLGIGILSERADRLMVGDRTPANVAIVRAHHPGVRALCLDAGSLPLDDGTFDAVVLLEAIYYLPDARRALTEVRRVLRPGGRSIVSTVNPRGRDFGRSPLSTRYYDSVELAELMSASGFTVSLFGGGLAGDDARARGLSFARRVSRVLRIPWPAPVARAIRRSLHGAPAPLPSEVALLDATTVSAVEPLPYTIPDTRHTVIYAVGRVPARADP